jgi:hypothetical protein
MWCCFLICELRWNSCAAEWRVGASGPRLPSQGILKIAVNPSVEALAKTSMFSTVFKKPCDGNRLRRWHPYIKVGTF